MPIAGIEFDSRHGDGLTLWALYEHPCGPVVSTSITLLGNAVAARVMRPWSICLLDRVWVDRRSIAWI
ncbi:hypothetical protein B2J88_44385 [Rhodococcus sp. SRB_17]|nr:hypothetical protein [Rhodococcus sp. SRB_17]